MEPPFGLTPDPRFFYRSETHASACDLLHYAIERREGFVALTGEIGTGKTMLCRTVLGGLGRRTVTALVLNPFLSEEDLLRLILRDFGVVSHEDLLRGRLDRVSKPALIETLHDFLFSLVPLGASALLVIDEAQNLPPQVLEQIRILSNLETDSEKLLQVVLVGQPNLRSLLRTPQMRQLDQRITVRCQLRRLTRRETAAYIEHRLAVAGGSGTVRFTTRALNGLHRFAGGTPRLINLLCDRAMRRACVDRARRVDFDHVTAAAQSLDLRAAGVTWLDRLRRRAALLAAGAVGSTLLVTGAADLKPFRTVVVEPQPPTASGAQVTPTHSRHRRQVVDERESHDVRIWDSSRGPRSRASAAPPWNGARSDAGRRFW